MKRFFTFLVATIFVLGFATSCDEGGKKKKTEICDNEVDDDGDGLIDCDDVDDCASDTHCQTPVEICDNGTDDDGDNAIDCDDTDCTDNAACVVNTKQLTVIQTTDLHSHLMCVGPARDYTPLNTSDNDGTKSGLARIAAIIKNIRTEKEEAGIPTILVDSGDSLMGDMVDLLSGSVPPIFHFFQLMDYDAITLGNHDWDWTPTGTATIIQASIDRVEFNRPLLAGNMVTDSNDPRDDEIETFVENGVIQRFIVKPIDDDFSVGMFGLMGIEADSNVPQAKPVTFWHEDPDDSDHGYDRIKALLDEVRAAGANMLVYVSHAGINANGIGEDRDMAANVTGIDLIMSGHRHQLLQAANGYIKVGSTYIVAAGKYGENMSSIDVTYDLAQSKITEATAHIYDVDDTVEGDPQIAALMEGYIQALDEQFLIPNMGITYSATPIGHTTFEMPAIDFYQDPLPTGYEVETPMALMVADAQYNITNGIISQALEAGLGADPTFDGTLFDAAFIENGAVRDPIMAGKTGFVAASDAFKAFPLGIGPDGVPGYPMMSFYVTPQEMKKILDMNVEVMSGNVPLEYYMNPAGVRYVFDNSRSQFDKVIAVFNCPPNDAFSTVACYMNGTLLDLTDETTNNMLRITVDYYVALLLPEVRNALGQHMTIDPKRKDGTVIDMTNATDVASVRFDASPLQPEIQELKAWVALIMFIGAFDDDWSSTVIGQQNGNPIYLHTDEPTDGAPSFPSRVYDKARTPSPTDPWWQLGLKRGIEKQEFCAMYSHPSICQ